MTQKIYKTARGKQVDVGSLRLQNENVRAVGNMGVNARGDRIDSQGNIIDPKNQQLQRRIQRRTNVSDGTVHTSVRNAQQSADAITQATNDIPGVTGPDIDSEDDTSSAVIDNQTTDNQGGLAAAIAKAKTVKQELEKTPRQKLQDQPVRKI